MKAVVYGVSTEGYSIAKALALKGIDVAMIDEGKGMAISIKPDIAISYVSVNAFLEDEQLLKFEPESNAIESADYIFFTPIVKRLGQEAYNEILGKLKVIAKHLKGNSTFVYCIPTGIGGNKDILDIIERASGMNTANKKGSSSNINYCYMPIMPDGMVYIVGSNSKIDQLIYSVCEQLNMNTNINVRYMDVNSAEIIYAIKVLANYMPIVTSFEVCKGIDESIYSTLINEKWLSDVFIDDLTMALFDMHMLANSMENSILVHMVNNCIRSIEGYSKHLVDRIRQILKRNDIRASRTRILITWSIDSNSMRNDRMITLTSLASKLRDYIGEVNRYDNSTNISIYHDEKTLLILTCSRLDHERVMSRYSKEGRDNVIIIKANPMCEVVSKIK
jgi:hypothetical protein